MEHLATDALFPEYNIWEQYTTDAMGAALRLDSLRSSHPIQVPIVRAEEVEQVTLLHPHVLSLYIKSESIPSLHRAANRRG